MNRACMSECFFLSFCVMRSHIEMNRSEIMMALNKNANSKNIKSVKDITQMTLDEKYMKQAIKQAKKAYAIDEVPIGCVIVNDADGKIIARGYNRRNTDKNTLSHAELNAIRKASKKLGDWRLEGCTMYVTLEPCQMCAGALVQSRIDRVVIGSMNPKAGCAGSVLNLLQIAGFNHQVEIVQGVCQEECSAMLSSFFKELREKKKQESQKKKQAIAEAEK